ncbi:adenylate/guanylate cyclase domain-containing protein [Taklimakanibacter lacteus]|uniref:adenylate/guanylate cyclase domain-containing protein n=1 Tax=Taklimakanibacter lacteus TaxID=2268456 RepID=UPI000E671077
MAHPDVALPHKMTLPRVSLRQARLATGLVLFAFVLTHFLNHAVGLVSIDAMEWVRDLRTAVTRSLVGTLILAGAFVIHFVLGVVVFVGRRNLRIAAHEWVQLAFGLLIPLLLMRHVTGLRVAHEYVGFEDNYTYALWVMWTSEAVRQAVLMILVWVHGCIGLHHWLEFRSWYRDLKWLWVALATLIPALAYAGFASAGRAVRYETDFQPPFTPEQYKFLLGLMNYEFYGYLGVLAAVVAVRAGLSAVDHYRHKITVTYTGGQRVSARRGMSVLEISRFNNIPHASVCGGRARCSTCRVRVIEGAANEPPPDAGERRVLQRVGAPANVRLACQYRPVSDITVTTLLPAVSVDALGGLTDKYFWGVEQDVTVMFCDLRGFTRLSEQRLSYDVVFLLNQYLGRMSEVINDTGGYVDKFMGDGIMAIFGMDRPAKAGARDALAATRAMGGVLDALNQSLHEELRGKLEMGIGLHAGTAILGRIGAAGKSSGAGGVTALGDTVNTASRLEGACKELNMQAIISTAVLDKAGVERGGLETRRIDIRGRVEPIEVVAVKRATELPALEFHSTPDLLR